MDDPRASANRVDASILVEDLIDCAALEVEMVQAVVTRGELPMEIEESQEAVFRAAGLKLEAVLCQLEKQLVPTQEPSMFKGDTLLQLGPDLRMIDANAIEEDRLESIVEATYIDTLDVPELNGIRSTHNTITGYAACVHSTPMPWWVIQWQQKDIGCLFLCQHGVELVELVYIGLSPEGRGNRLSHEIMEFVHKWSSSRGASRIVAAVDSRNEPALRLYRYFGYEQVGLANAWFLAT
jgi:ribosomal protein S18 acetylase RimI-like enzyme